MVGLEVWPEVSWGHGVLVREGTLEEGGGNERGVGLGNVGKEGERERGTQGWKKQVNLADLLRSVRTVQRPLEFSC